MSRPSTLVRKYGPIGAAPDSANPASIALIDRPCSSWARKTSEIPAVSTRLTTNPGTSAHVIGCLRIAWANVIAACIVSGDVWSPSTISISGIVAAG